MKNNLNLKSAQRFNELIQSFTLPYETMLSSLNAIQNAQNIITAQNVALSNTINSAAIYSQFFPLMNNMLKIKKSFDSMPKSS